MWIARTGAVLVFATGLWVLSGWAFDIAAFKTVLPGWTKMAPVTALCFVLAAAALGCLATGRSRQRELKPIWFRLSQICAAVVAVVGILRLIEYRTGWNIGLDHLLPFRELPGVPDPARMAPVTAFDFVMAGIALLLAGTSWFKTFQLPVFVGGFVSWLGISQHLFGGEPLFHFQYIMAVHASIAFLLLNMGIFCLRTDGGLMALLVSDSAGGLIARRLVPAALVVPIILGWLGLKGQRAGLFGNEAGLSLFAFSNVLVFGGLIWANAALLHHADTKRKQAEAKLQTQLSRLDLLNQITRAIAEHQDLQSIYQVVIRSLEDHLPVDFGCICLYDAAAGTVIVAGVGVKSEALATELAMPEKSRIPVDQNGLARAVRGDLVYEPDISQIKFPFPERLARGGLRSLVITPLIVESVVFGVLVVARREPGTFSSGDCEFLRQLSGHTGLAAHQAQMNNALQSAYDDLRQTQQAVMQQERLRALGEMASGISHDINNSLSPVMLYTGSLLESEKQLSTSARDKLETIQRAVTDVAETIARLKEFYHQREPQLNLAPVDLNVLAQQVVDLTRARWHDMPQQQGIVIHMRTDLMPDLPPVMGAESEIREALINLVFNAVDAMPQGGILTLRTKVSDKNVCMEIADTGTGMDKETRRRCLEPFFTTKGARGTGLGLAMVYGIVQRHNAGLEIETEPGKGTTISLMFPVASPPATAGPAGLSEQPRVLTRLRLLVVDDDPLVLKSLRDILEADGHVVVTASGGQAGIDALHAALARKEPFAAVITDLGMPYVDGRAVASAVKAASPATPVILLTGWGKRLADKGEVPPHVDYMLSKPPKPAELREALAQCISAS